MSTNETSLFVRFLIMCDFVFVQLVIVQFFSISFCKDVRLSYVINAYLLTHLLTYLLIASNIVGNPKTQ